jgi:hypothetical protein
MRFREVCLLCICCSIQIPILFLLVNDVVPPINFELFGGFYPSKIKKDVMEKAQNKLQEFVCGRLKNFAISVSQ